MDGVLNSTAVTKDRGALCPPIADGRIDTRSVAAANREFDLSDRDFRRIVKKIYSEAGIVLGEQKRDMVIRRLSKRVRACQLSGFDRYMDKVESGDKVELEQFRNALTTNLTSFFREAHHFDRLKQYFAEHGSQRSYRIWSAASSTGEEPYSIAMTAVEHFRTERPPVRILCTDIDSEVVNTASQGIYTMERVESLSLERKQRFFLRGAGSNDGLVKVSPALQGFMQFRTMNLLAARGFDVEPGLDVIFLRNVMIYFDRETQLQLLKRMHSVLSPDGLLIVGHSENLFHASQYFRSTGQTVYKPTVGVAG